MPITTPVTLLTPFRRQLELLITQAPGGELSHDGDLYYGWDFAGASTSLFEGQVLSVAEGRVVFIEQSVPDGGPVSGSDGSDGAARDPSLGPPGALGNVVTIEHSQNGQLFYASYLHLQQNSVPLEVGDPVVAGQVIGKVGNTGFRDGTHLHINIGPTLGAYTNAAGADFSDYQIAEGADDGGAALELISFSDSPRDDGKFIAGDQFSSSVNFAIEAESDLYLSPDVRTDGLVPLSSGSYANVIQDGSQQFELQILSDTFERISGPIEINPGWSRQLWPDLAVQPDGTMAVAWSAIAGEIALGIRVFGPTAAPVSDATFFP